MRGDARLLIPAVFLGALSLAARPAMADTLEGAVLFAHLNPTIQYTSSTPSYEGQADLSICEEAIPQGAVDEEHAQVWFVMASFSNSPGPTGLRAIEFGFGAYNSSCLAIIDFGHCLGSDVQQITTGAWPGPGEGIAMAHTHGSAGGQLVEVYWIACYAYCPVVVPLDVNPTTANAMVIGVSSDEGDLIYAENRGSIGFGQMGHNPCGGVANPTGACCLWDDQCSILEEEECSAEGGIYQGDFTSCLPNPCDRPVIETTWGLLKKMYE
ncbi:MAG: hypothetical protein KAY32_01480 [Candidatus Eisenbacteria sp.]|nr:hypothetical protein [Candidatus Eisenbacteria bacterium]